MSFSSGNISKMCVTMVKIYLFDFSIARFSSNTDGFTYNYGFCKSKWEIQSHVSFWKSEP